MRFPGDPWLALIAHAKRLMNTTPAQQAAGQTMRRNLDECIGNRAKKTTRKTTNPTSAWVVMPALGEDQQALSSRF